MQVKNSFLNGQKLIGDDFDENQIAKWYNEELEYSKLYPFEGKSEEYPYHQLNCVHVSIISPWQRNLKQW